MVSRQHHLGEAFIVCKIFTFFASLRLCVSKLPILGSFQIIDCSRTVYDQVSSSFGVIGYGLVPDDLNHPCLPACPSPHSRSFLWITAENRRHPLAFCGFLHRIIQPGRLLCHPICMLLQNYFIIIAMLRLLAGYLPLLKQQVDDDHNNFRTV
jgi:hypothetical protein